MSEDKHQYITRYCSVCGYQHHIRLYCGDRLCPVCRQTNYLRLLDYYLPVIGKIPARRLSQMTLTYRNVRYLSKDFLSSFTRDLNRLRRTDFFRSRVKGGLMVIECKHNSDKSGWNLHAHLLLDCSFIPQKELARRWHYITGHSYIVDIRQEEQSRNAVFHLLKYFSKIPVVRGKDYTDLNNQYNRAFYGSRNIISFGSLYNAISEDYLPYRFKCPKCGNSEWFSEFEMRSLEKRSCSVKCGVG